MKVCLLITLVLIFSCTNPYNKKNGYYEVRNSNGIPQYIKYYNDKGELDGASISFNPKGELNSFIYMKDGIEIGPSMIYYSDGSLNICDTYIEGKQEGVSVHYNPKGILTRKSYYRNGLKEGEQYYFNYETGDTIKIEVYSKGKLLDSIVRFAPLFPSMSRNR